MTFRYETDTSNFDPIDPDKLRPENEERYSNCTFHITSSVKVKNEESS